MPRIHDMKAIRADRPLYEDLYRRTAAVAAPAIRAAMERVTAGEAARLFEAQVTGLQQYLLEGRAAAGSQGIGAEFGRFLQADLAAGAGDDALCRELSDEFARALWDSLLMQMAAHSERGAVRRPDLLPAAAPDANADGGRWSGVFQNLEPYSLSEGDVARIVREVLAQLAQEANVAERIRLPLGLSVDRAMLVRLLDGEPEPDKPKGIMEMLRELVNFTT